MVTLWSHFWSHYGGIMVAFLDTVSYCSGITSNIL
jgi:hypothetical protein